MKAFPRGASRIGAFALLFLAAARMTAPAKAQNQELTLSLGGIPGQARSFKGSNGTAQISPDRSLGLNYGHRLLGAKVAALVWRD
jgi:hypothetical protein